jgi:hypothetical protein
MKLEDSDLIQEYNATKRLGNPATAALGDAKQLREHMHDTTSATPTLKSWDNELLQSLREMDLKSTGYKQVVDGFCDTLAIAEDMFNEEEIAKAFIESLEEQRNFYKTKQHFYDNLLANIKFKLNEK